MVKVSFIIGTYNGSNKLHLLFESILNQTFKDYEIIVCDDASNDDTLDILNEYKIKFPKIFTIITNEKTCMLAASLNKCLTQAKGEYIARIDDDDICYRDRLEKQVKFLDENENIDCVGSYMDVYDGNNIQGVRKIISNPTLETLIKGGYTFHHPTIMIRKNVIYRLNGYRDDLECKRCEDLDLWYRFFILGFNGYNIEESLIRYSESLSDYNKKSLSNILIANKLRRKYRKVLNKSILYDFIYLKTIIFSILPKKLKFLIKNSREY